MTRKGKRRGAGGGKEGFEPRCQDIGTRLGPPETIPEKGIGRERRGYVARSSRQERAGTSAPNARPGLESARTRTSSSRPGSCAPPLGRLDPLGAGAAARDRVLSCVRAGLRVSRACARWGGTHPDGTGRRSYRRAVFINPRHAVTPGREEGLRESPRYQSSGPGSLPRESLEQSRFGRPYGCVITGPGWPQARRVVARVRWITAAVVPSHGA